MVEVNSGSFKMISLNPNRYGGTEGASFCALTTLCKELDTFNAIDVYQVIFFSVTDNKLELLSLANLVLFYIALERGRAGVKGTPQRHALTYSQIFVKVGRAFRELIITFISYLLSVTEKKNIFRH